jgi:prepilin-type N-terminal cleavage/methylation domain-containing protein
MVTRSLSAGFTLLEVVVSLSLICSTLFGVTAACAWAARTTRAAEALENSLAHEEALVDSLLRIAGPASGSVRRGRATITWSAQRAESTSRIDARAEYFDGVQARSVTIMQAAAARALPEIGPPP